MSKIIEIAAAEIGYKEGAGKANKFGQWFGFDRVAWCAMFVSWCYDKAGVSLGRGDWPKGWASVPNMLIHYNKTLEVTQFPVAGDIAIFDWQHDGKVDHVGLFEKDNGDGTITTIEGNTSDGNPSNGGCVERKIRKKTLVAAFIHPKVADKLT